MRKKKKREIPQSWFSIQNCGISTLLVRLAGLEPTTPTFVVWYSIR